jgi:hypothetical protein
VTRAQALVGVLAAVGVGTLLWCARLILAADLTFGTSAAAWALWTLVAAAVGTLLLYAREIGRHRHSVTRGGSWKPLPSLVLVWIGGATAVGVFLFMLPASASGGGGDEADRSTATKGTSAPTGATAGTDPRVSPTTVSRSHLRTTTPVVSPTSSTSSSRAPGTTRSQTGATTPRQSASTTAPSTSSSTTTTPLVTITLPSGQIKTTTKPPHPH